jgi:hypothetical protein
MRQSADKERVLEYAQPNWRVDICGAEHIQNPPMGSLRRLLDSWVQIQSMTAPAFQCDTIVDGRKTRLFWKTTTNTVGDVVEEESWNAVNEGSLRAVEATPGWQLFDIRCVTMQVLLH